MENIASSTVKDDHDKYVYSVDILFGPTKVCGILDYRTGRVEHTKGKV